MRIEGLQKLTLLDYPGKLACTVFLAGCDLRCPFCHNADLVLAGRPSDPIPESELLAFLKKRRGVLEGVCVTGVEPLLSPDLPALLQKIRALGYAVKLDTNGTFPDRLMQIVAAGLVDYVAMDIKNAPGRYAGTVGVPDFDEAPVRRSAAYLLSGAVDCEFRTTVVAQLHTEADFTAIGQWLAGAKRYYLQGFVDSGNLIGSGLSAAPKAEMERFLAAVKPFIPTVELRGV